MAGISKGNQTIDQHFLVDEWLECGASWPDYTKFLHVPLSEHVDKRKEVLKALAETIFMYHNDPSEYSEIVAELGYSQAAAEFDKRPKDDKTRKANFGEVIASEYLRQVQGYDIPVYRLRWNTNPDTSMRGEDVLAFKFGENDGTGREVCVAEAKVMSKFDKEEVKTAHEQLRTGYRPRPNSIPFLHSVLRLQGEHKKAASILSFQKRLAPHPPKRSSFIMVITGNHPRDPFSTLQTESEVVDNLSAANLALSDLANLVNALFSAEVNIDSR